MARRAKFTQWAMVWSQEKKTIDQAMSLWKVMFLSKSMMLLRGVWRRREMRPRQTATCQRWGLLGAGEVTEEDKGYVDVEGQCGGSSDGVGDAKQGTCLCQVVLLLNEIEKGSVTFIE